jgi:hypothetical protein
MGMESEEAEKTFEMGDAAIVHRAWMGTEGAWPPEFHPLMYRLLVALNS